jgi:hypothetical protein
MPRRIPCTDKIRETIGWAPELNLENILTDVVAERVGKIAVAA